MSGQPPGLPPYSGPRRFSSYAAVASGQAAQPSMTTPHNTTLTRSGPPGSSYPPSMSAGYGHYGRRSIDDGRSGTRGDAYAGVLVPGAVGPVAGGVGADQSEEHRRTRDFFIPSYLRGTRQARRLEEAQNARLHAQRSQLQSGSTSLSTSSSSVNVHKMVPSHRGMTHDIIERAPPLAPEEPAPLPSRWQLGQDVTGMDLLNGGLEARYSGLTKQHDEAAGVKGDVCIPRECGVFYYEVTVGTKQKENVLISIGFAGPKVTARRMPGWEPDSYGYSADDGCLLLGNSNNPKKYASPYGNGDVIGCGVNFHRNHVFFTKNGNHLGPAITNIRHDRLFPAVGLKRAGDHVRVNFGQGQFVFDIDSLVEAERQEIHAEIMSTSVTQLSGDRQLTEPQLLHKLVAQYLAHDGYIETARAFAAEVRSEQHNLSHGIADAGSQQEVEDVVEDVDAIHRQKIRSAILNGNIDRALKYTNVYYPDVLGENENICFRLKLRKFIEMIRRCAELSDADSIPRNSSDGDDNDNGVFEHQMELDDLNNNNMNGDAGFGKWSATAVDGMETSTESLRDQLPETYTSMITKTVQYGSELKAEFDNDVRREVKKQLKETLALIGYQDPRVSPLRGLLEESGRAPVAEELNRAILVSLGKSSSSAIENVFAQTDVLLDIVGKDGGPGALIDLRSERSRSGRIL